MSDVNQRIKDIKEEVTIQFLRSATACITDVVEGKHTNSSKNQDLIIQGHTVNISFMIHSKK
jgi:hypothetical protein